MVSFLLLQLADSAFPAGGLGHSGGLEAAAALGEVRGETLSRWLEHAVHGAASAQLPFVSAAHREPGALREIDAACHASIASDVARRASRAQGRAWLRAAAGLGEPLAELEERALREDVEAHLAPVFGAVCSRLGLPLDDAQRLFLFVVLRGLVSSAVRLAMVGPFAAQALQRELGPALAAAWALGKDLGIDEVATTAPLPEIAQGHHDRLYSRMFSS